MRGWLQQGGDHELKNNPYRQRSAIPQNPISLMYKYYRYILPEVRKQLRRWRHRAESIPDQELRAQALASISSKQFHCEGGAVYAAINIRSRQRLIPLIVAFQTISDYLDNLCDRSTSLDENDFRLLHQSMLDAVDPKAPIKDYYALHQEQEDGGYLRDLVTACQSIVSELPAYDVVKDHVIKLVSLYCDLQVYKHIHPDEREQALEAWWKQHQQDYPSLHWNEFAAATGSTLGVFMLMAAATHPHLSESEAEAIKAAYFPYICGEHILLDYLIDQQEDREGGDLNFCVYYASPEHAAERIGYIVKEAKRSASRLKSSRFHRMVVEGLMALYLSDPKASGQRKVRVTRGILMRGSPVSRLFFWFNSMWVRRTQS